MSLLVEKFFIDVGALCGNEEYVGEFGYYIYKNLEIDDDTIETAMGCLLISSKFLCDDDLYPSNRSAVGTWPTL